MRIGTRGSALALAQAGWVAERLGAHAELVTITTSGDRGEVLNDKSEWVSELEHALLEGEIDLAVHSAKDVPAELPDGLSLVAIPPRADPRDVLCGAPGLNALPAGARVGTSSLRRAAQLRAAREDLEVVPVRGNVDTRLRKLTDGEVDALVLARAGLERLDRLGDAGGVLDHEEFVPAAGQGALALEARTGTEVPAALRDRAATLCVGAERSLVRALEANCDTPMGAFARAVDDGQVELIAWVGRADGSAWIRDALTGPPEGIGAHMAERLLAVGARELLA